MMRRLVCTGLVLLALQKADRSPLAARRRALDARLEAIIKKPKKTGGKKKRGQQEDVR